MTSDKYEQRTDQHQSHGTLDEYLWSLQQCSLLYRRNAALPLLVEIWKSLPCER